MVLLLWPGLALTQDIMTHEELMRRARGLPSQPKTNVSPPAPAQPAVALASASDKPVNTSSHVAAPQNISSNQLPVRHNTFSEVPPEFYDEPPVRATVPTNAMSMDGLDDKHLLAIGDRLSFRIIEDNEDPRSLVITDSGELEVPYLGRFPATGKSCRKLATALKAELEKDYYYQATVIIAVDLKARNRGKVYLVGPVRSPGPLEIPSDEVLTLSKALLRAGGFTDFADQRRVKVTRKPVTAAGVNENFTINVEEILKKGKTETDLPLEAGDLVYVPERMIRF